MHTILIADDEQRLLEIMRMFLERFDYEIITAADGIEAWRLINLHSPDLLILDDTMPGMTGSEICRRVKSDPFLQKIPVIMHSANPEFSDKSYLYQMKADALLVKPSLSQDIIDIVARWLATSK